MDIRMRLSMFSSFVDRLHALRIGCLRHRLASALVAVGLLMTTPVIAQDDRDDRRSDSPGSTPEAELPEDPVRPSDDFFEDEEPEIIVDDDPIEITSEDEGTVWTGLRSNCPDVDASEIEEMFDLGRRSGRQGGPKNYLIFNHERGVIEKPVPAQLEVGDGEAFVIVFACTDPSRFDYLIEPIKAAEVRKAEYTSTPGSVAAQPNQHASLTWRHDRHFPLYRVTVSIREAGEQEETDDGQPSFVVRDLLGRLNSDELDRLRSMAIYGVDEEGIEEAADEFGVTEESLEAMLAATWSQMTLETTERRLYSYTFPVWVKTVGWEISFSTGIGFSRLTDEQYFIKTDDMGNDDASDDVKTVLRDRDAEDDFIPDLVAMANLQLPSHLQGWRRLGLAFGIGTGGQSEPRYFLGPSVRLGRQLILTLGLAGGKVDTLPTGQEIGEPPINGDNTLAALGSRFTTAAFVGIAFNFAPSEKEFLSALTGAQRLVEEEKGKEDPNDSDGDDDSADDDDDDDDDGDDDGGDDDGGDKDGDSGDID